MAPCVLDATAGRRVTATAMLDPDGHGTLEQLLDFGRRRCRREIEIVILDARRLFADRPAQAPCLEPRILQARLAIFTTSAGMCSSAPQGRSPR